MCACGPNFDPSQERQYRFQKGYVIKLDKFLVNFAQSRILIIE